MNCVNFAQENMWFGQSTKRLAYINAIRVRNVTRCIEVRRDTTPARWDSRMKIEYALYKGDEFLGIGTAEELASKYGGSASYIRWLSQPTALRRFEKSKGERKIVVRLGPREKWEENNE